MWKIRHLSRSGLSLAVGLLVGALTLGTTYAVSSGPSPETAASSKASVGYVGLSPLDFAPQSSDEAAEGYWTFWTRVGISFNAQQCFQTGLTVPGGAKLQRVVLWFEGNGSSSSPSFAGAVFRSDPANGTSRRIAGGSAPGTRDGITRLVIEVGQDWRTIRNDKWLYGVGFCAEDGYYFLGARAIYTR
jgi:hypothetical protein